MLSSVDRLFYPLVLYCLYLSVGPWSICEVIDNHYGAIFVWGIYVNGSYLPGALTYLYGFFQLSICQLPLIWIYARRVANRYHQACGMPSKKHRSSFRKLSKAPFYVIISIEILLAVFFELSYGLIAFLICPFRTWSVLMNILLFHMANNLPDEKLKPAIYVWSASDKVNGDEKNDES